MAKTKEQRTAAHQRQLERAARKRQVRNVLRSTLEPSDAATFAVEPTVDSQALSQKGLVSYMDAEQACSGEMDVRQHATVAEHECRKESLSPPFSAEIIGRRRCTNSCNDTKFIICLTGLDGTSTVERAYTEFEALLTEVQPVMPELPAMPPNTLQHVCIAGRYVEMREEGLRRLLTAMLEVDSTLEFPRLRNFVLMESSVVHFPDQSQVAEEDRSLEALEGMCQDIALFPRVAWEAGRKQHEQHWQEISDIPAGEMESTQNEKERAARLEQAAPDKSEEPRVSPMEVISDTEASTDEFPMSSDFSSDEDGEEVSWAAEQPSNLSVFESAEERQMPAELESAALDNDKAKAATEEQATQTELDELEAVVMDFMSASAGEAPADSSHMSALCDDRAYESEIIGGVEKPRTFSLELDEMMGSLSVHMNFLTNSVKEGNMPNELETAAATVHEMGKAKLQMRDLKGTIQRFVEAEAIHRHMGTLKTLAGAHLLLDLSVAKLVDGDVDATLDACGGICEYAGLLRTPAAIKFLHQVAELPCQCGTLTGVRRILAAAFSFMEDVHKSEIDTFVSRWSESLSTPVEALWRN